MDVVQTGQDCIAIVHEGGPLPTRSPILVCGPNTSYLIMILSRFFTWVGKKNSGHPGGTIGSSPSGFTTRETKVHVACESELDNWRSRLGCLGMILAEPAKFIPQYLVEKPFISKKRSSNWVYKKWLFFDFK